MVLLFCTELDKRIFSVMESSLPIRIFFISFFVLFSSVLRCNIKLRNDNGFETITE